MRKDTLNDAILQRPILDRIIAKISEAVDRATKRSATKPCAPPVEYRAKTA